MRTEQHRAFLISDSPILHNKGHKGVLLFLHRLIDVRMSRGFCFYQSPFPIIFLLLAILLEHRWQRARHEQMRTRALMERCVPTLNGQLALAWINERTFTGAVRGILRHYISLRASTPRCMVRWSGLSNGSMGQWEESWPQPLQRKFVHGITQWKTIFLHVNQRCCFSA